MFIQALAHHYLHLTSDPSGGEDAFQEKFTIPAGSVKAECFGFDMTRGDAFAEDIFTLTLTVDDHTVPSTSATVTITES